MALAVGDANRTPTAKAMGHPSPTSEEVGHPYGVDPSNQWWRSAMSIEFRCQSCGKSVRASDEAGGKRGKCPYCKVSVYIPAPTEESGEIGLAPVDESTQARQEQLRQESIRYAASVDGDQSPKPRGFSPRDASAPKPRGFSPRDASARAEARGSGASASSEPGKADKPANKVGDAVIDFPDEIANFVRAMHQSKLDVAERIAGRLKRRSSQTKDYVQDLLVDQMGLTIEGIPPPLVQGFLKKLLERL